jgi:hypothetical protein
MASTEAVPVGVFFECLYGATTSSISTFRITTLSITIKKKAQHNWHFLLRVVLRVLFMQSIVYADCQYAECHMLSVIMLSVIMLSVIC